MNPFDYFIEALKKYATFKGRARRSEYWYFFLFYVLLIILAVFIDDLLFNRNPDEKSTLVLTLVFGLSMIIPLLAVAVRRLHDTNCSGWWILIRFIPIIGQLILIILLATDGTPGRNDYGENPKNPYPEEDDIMDHLID